MHFKRSPEFQREIAGLLDALESGTMQQSETLRIAQILRTMTTDSKCMLKAKDNAPIFVIIPTDRLASHVVGYWAANSVGIHEPEKIQDAMRCSEEMSVWLTNHPQPKAKKKRAARVRKR